MKDVVRFRIATYNIHKCLGFDRKTSPDRIIAVLSELDAHVLCLQEVVDAPQGPRVFDQAREIASAFPDYTWCFGSNRSYRGGNYGNMTLTRFPLQGWQNYDITHGMREKRGVLHANIAINPGQTVRVFNLHLGTGYIERRSQAARLLSVDVLGHQELNNPRLLVGDFNEWASGLATRLLRGSFKTFQPRHGLRFPRTYPGILPVLSLDYCYYEAPLQLESARLWRTRRALIASDHLPLVAEFHVQQECAGRL
ncbi:endonuclease/exonuclease/phosphatase family protein [Alloacidobacterium sp.]|uniref:endonuclease/exonuclease/phosphatase family protein n=1 Tax=Alloacidobacterium sp. TaxID=2951999 RepID=UPI002D381EB4|nr:endonuclease/exonuclease/phosphatase family protein [Alloacidobacterium sp.]HYK35069.1 endonuclease/exonuclease/phosphatase family protein [Alloacidobacterium sp.]